MVVIPPVRRRGHQPLSVPVWVRMVAGTLAFVCAGFSSHAAEPDSAAAPTIFDRTGIHPMYNSTIDVNRASTYWTQALNTQRNGTTLKAENDWNSSVQKNSDQNNFVKRVGQMKARMESHVKRAGDWSSGFELDMGRIFAGSDFDRTINNSAGANLFLTSNLLGSLGRSALGFAENEFDWTVTGSAGLTNQVNVTERKSSKDAAVPTSWDSTSAGGSTQGLDSQLSMMRGSSLKLQLLTRLNNGREDSETQTFKNNRPQAYEVLPKEVNRDTQRLFGMNSSFTPSRKTKINLSSQVNRTFKEFFSSQVQTRETTHGLDQRLALDCSFEPLWGIELGIKGDNSLQILDYAVTNQDQGKRAQSVTSQIHFTTGPGFGLFQNVESSAELEWEQNHTSYGGGTPYDDKHYRIRESLRRAMSKEVVLLVTGEEQLGRWYYPDHSQDRDELRLLLDSALGYRPLDNLETRLTGQYQQREIVNIAAAKSAASSNQNSYRIEGTLGYTINPQIKINQKYAMSADYTFYRFNENSNGLVRTTEVRTTLNSTVGTKAKLDLEHQYRFKDSGQYVREGVGPRLYSKATEEFYQFLTLTTRYDFAEGFNLHAQQRMEVRRNIQTSTHVVKITPKIQFTGGLDLDHNFSNEFSVSAHIDRTQSDTEKNYWRISATVNRKF